MFTLYFAVYVPILNQKYETEINEASCSELNLLLKENLTKYGSQPWDVYKRQAIFVANELVSDQCEILIPMPYTDQIDVKMMTNLFFGFISVMIAGIIGSFIVHVAEHMYDDKTISKKSNKFKNILHE